MEAVSVCFFFERGSPIYNIFLIQGGPLQVMDL